MDPFSKAPQIVGRTDTMIHTLADLRLLTRPCQTNISTVDIFVSQGRVNRRSAAERVPCFFLSVRHGPSNWGAQGYCIWCIAGRLNGDVQHKIPRPFQLLPCDWKIVMDHFSLFPSVKKGVKVGEPAKRYPCTYIHLPNAAFVCMVPHMHTLEHPCRLAPAVKVGSI